MTSQRAVVVPAYRPSGMVGYAAFLGTLSGIASGSSFLWGRGREMGTASIDVALFAVGSLAPLFFGIAFSIVALLITQQRVRVFLLVGAYCAFMMSAEFALIAVLHATTGLGWSWSVLPSILLEGAACGIVGGSIALVVRFAVRSTAFIAIEFDPHLCLRCAYRIGPESVAACPECGTSRNVARFRWRWIHSATSLGRRVGWAGVAVILLVGALYFGESWSGKVAPSNRFAEQMRRFGALESGTICLAGADPMKAGPAGVAVRIPLDPVRSLDLVIVKPAQPIADAVFMQIQLSKVLSARRGAKEKSLGIPAILCDLNAEQAEEVMKNGVPQSLKDEMLKAEAGVSWDVWLSAAPPPPDVRIDPSPHFPKLRD